MQEMELIINNPQRGQFLDHIGWNKDEFEAMVQAVIKDYQGIAYTEDQIKSAKADRATLNKLRKSINDRRIQIKKSYMAPYDTFESEVKSVLGEIDSTVTYIDMQVRSFEDRKRKDRYDQLKECFDASAEELSEKIDFNQVLDQKWLNLSEPMTRCIDALIGRIAAIRTDLELIDNLEKPYDGVARRVYLNGLDIKAAYSEAERARDVQRQIDEARKARAAEMDEGKVERPAVVPAAVPVNDNPPVEIPKEPEVQKEPEAPKKRMFAQFKVYGTREELMALRQYMIDHHLEFGKID